MTESKKTHTENSITLHNHEYKRLERKKREKVITRGQAEEEKSKKAVKVEKILLLQGEKVL